MLKKVKIFLLILFTSLPLFADGFLVPREDGYVRDITGTLSPQQEAELEAYSQQLETKTQDQVATLVVNNFDGSPVEEAAVRAFEKWGIGQKGKDNGVLFIIAIQDRKMRIEVGYGLEGTLPDGKTGAILDNSVKPLLKNGQLAEGIMAAHKQIIAAIDPTILPVRQHTVQKQAIPLSRLQKFVLQNIFIVLIVLIGGLLYISPGFRTFLLLLLLSGRFGGGSGGGSGGGGFGGFGGGRSGGGGSSRDW